MYGGLEVLLTTLARHASLTPELKQEFAVCFEGRLTEELRAIGAAVQILGPVRFSRPWTVWRARRVFRQWITSHRPDLLICHATWPFILLSAEAARAGVPVVFWQHDIHNGVSWLDRRTRASKVRPALAIAGSQFAAANTKTLFPEIAVEVVPCAVTHREPRVDRETTRRDLGTGPDTVVILQASRLEKYKGTHVLIEAFGQLRASCQWHLWIAGAATGPSQEAYRDDLVARANALGIADRVRFLGLRSDVPDLLAAADIYAQANVEPEPFGIAFVEAMGAALPVVTTGIGGAVEILGDKCGVLVPPDDPRALTEALGRLIDDSSLRRSLGASGPLRAQTLCDPQVILNRLASVLHSIL